MKKKKHSPIRNQHIRNSHIIKFIITLAYCLISTLVSFGQVSDKGFPSPNAAALGKYADYPVSYFTGVPAINIPLYTLKDGAVTLPISLSYHASGIKVAEVASWVGLGWVLNAGGIITRTIKGAPDEGTNNRAITLNSPRGYYQDSGLSDKVRPGSSTLNSDLKLISVTNSVDMEPDIYTINVNGFVGKFVFDEKRNPTFLTKTDVKVAVEYIPWISGSSAGQFQRWIVTTPNGIQYIFGENGAKDINKLDASTNPDDNAPTSWYLTKIIYPNSTDSITIEYTPEKYTYRNLGSEFIAIQKEYTTRLEGHIGDPNWNSYSLFGVLPKKISTKNIELNFIAGTIRKDVEGNGHCLDNIQVKNKNTNTIIEEIKFNYDYFQSSNAGSRELATKDITDTKRLKLLNIQRGMTGSPLQASPYTFQYYEDVMLPRRCSYDQDHWGYANNWGGQNYHFTPYPKPEYATLIVRTDPSDRSREPAWPYTAAFSLKKITDPLGVNTSFEFESNFILKDTVNGDKIGGGLRIKRITVNDTVSHQKYVRKFDYSLSSTQSTGVILRKPAYWTKAMNEYMVVTTVPTTTYAGDAASGDKSFLNNYFKFSQSPFPLQDYQGYAVGYKQVKEIMGENGENGYKIYNYQAEDHPSATTRLQCSNYTSGGIPNGKFNSIAPENLVYSDPSTRGKYFPFEPEQVILSNGLLTKEQTFNKNNSLLSSVDYSYEIKYNEDKWIRGMICMPVVYTPTVVAAGHTPVPVLYYPLTYYKYRTGIARILSQKTTVVDTLTGKNAITETKYAYESPNHLQPTKQITINNGVDSVENVFRYSFDFDSTAISGGVINEMKKQNILSPLRAETWENGTLSNCSTTEYTKNIVGSKTTVVPIKTYLLKTKKNLSAADAGFTKAFSATNANLNGSSALMKLQGFYSYNNAGLLQQQGKIGDVPASYIWDYNNTIPIAVVSNAAPVDIAYTSFEADRTGGWTVTATDRVNTEAFTGNKCYDLSKGNITKTSLNSNKTYLVSYWAKTGASVSITNTTQTIQGPTANNWTLWTKKITATTTLTISGSGTIDELRLYPDKAKMKSSTYIPGIGITSSTDENNNVSIYEYDELNRLKLIRDGNRNIMKTYCYNYAGAPISCDGILFYNTARSIVFQRNNCPPESQVASSVTYNVPANKYNSIISQADADAKAQAEINANGQNYANANGTCGKVYIAISYEDINNTIPEVMEATIVFRFYKDAACTIPISVNNFPLNYGCTTSGCGGGYSASVSVNGYSYSVYGTLSETTYSGTCYYSYYGN